MLIFNKINILSSENEIVLISKLYIEKDINKYILLISTLNRERGERDGEGDERDLLCISYAYEYNWIQCI